MGINRAGESLVAHAPDLANRIDTVRFEVESQNQIERMIGLGEQVLNIQIAAKDQVAEAAQGSFYIAPLLCHELCLRAKVTERRTHLLQLDTSYLAAKRSVLDRQEVRFGSIVKKFARGNKFRPSGRGPYLRILDWLREAGDVVHARCVNEMALHPDERISVGQVVDKGPLATLVGSEGIVELFHYEPADASALD